MSSDVFAVEPDARPLILVVEDNPANSRLICEMLRAGGYRVHVAADGLQGLDRARGLRPALILTDLQMPGLDGLTLTQTLKSDPATAQVPVLAVTAHAMADHRASALAAGCAGFVTKPIRFQPFLAEIADVLRLTDACRA